METSERRPAVAGTFYAGEAETLRREVRDLLDPIAAADGPAPKAVIVPHAGFMFSGPVAARAYARLVPARDTIRRVVLLGPSHYVPLRGLAATSAERFLTPLGPVPVDREGVATALAQPGTQTLDAAHEREHSLETQLPFLQQVLADFRIVPLVVGDSSPEEVGRVLEALWGGPETLIVVSSDLSHFHDDATARTLDLTTARAIEGLEAEAVGHDNACGFHPVRGLLWVARRRGGRIATLDLRNSSEAGAPRDRVVGYGAFALEEGA